MASVSVCDRADEEFIYSFECPVAMIDFCDNLGCDAPDLGLAGIYAQLVMEQVGFARHLAA